MTMTTQEYQQTDKHAAARKGKANMPTIPLCSQATGDGGGDRTDIARGI